MKIAAGVRKHKKKNGKAVLFIAENARGKTELPDRFSCRAYGRRVAEGELPKLKIFDGEVGYGWRPGDVGQFDGLDTRDQVGRVEVPESRFGPLRCLLG